MEQAIVFVGATAAARAFATVAHEGQVGKTGKPYILHPAAVAAGFAADTHESVTAWLHDVVEDTDVTVAEIETRFGTAIARAVDAVSKRDGETTDGYLVRVLADPVALRVKRADLRDNSNPDRLALLARTDPATAERLRRKYDHTHAVLSRAS